MAKKLKSIQLLLISKSQIQTIGNMRFGAHLSAITALTIDQLVENATKDRYKLAQEFLKTAKRGLSGSKPQHRLALAKAYYAMYHAARAVVYYVEGGDDHEAHAILPKYLPKDFPDRDDWENEIKTARLERNRADYDPYPKSDRSFATIARATTDTSTNFLAAAKRYLARKGCNI